MMGDMHARIGRMAWQALRAEDRTVWNIAPELPSWAPDFLRSPPGPATAEEKFGLYCVALDLLGWRESETVGIPPDFLLPDGRRIPHGAATASLASVWCDESCFFDAWGWRSLMRGLAPRVFDALRAGDPERAALAAGVLGHVLQDSAAIGHLFPNSLLLNLVPDVGGEHMNIHSLFDQVSPALTAVTPSLLGATVPEAVFQLGILGEQSYAMAQQCLYPLVEAARRGDRGRVAERVQPLAQHALQQLASVLHTAAVLSRHEAPARGGAFDLTQAVPRYPHPGGSYGMCMPVNRNIVQGRLVPLRADLGRGVETVAPGLGLTSFQSLRYLLEPGAFARLEGAVALSADYTADQSPDMDVEFVIGLAKDWYRVQRMDLRYDPSLREVWSCPLVPGRPAQSFAVPLGDAQTLLLAVRPLVALRAGREVCWFPHVVLAHPRLVR